MRYGLIIPMLDAPRDISSVFIAKILIDDTRDLYTFPAFTKLHFMRGANTSQICWECFSRADICYYA